MVDKNRLADWLRKQIQYDFQLTLGPDQCAQFANYYERLIETNRSMNLTAITEEKEVYIKHFYDSLSLCKVQNFHAIQTVIDVGTGAGFPGIPLKIAFPHLNIVLLDSLQKRIRFLNEVIADLQLQSIEAIHGRAEECAQQKEYRERFDMAVARAVAKLNTLAEYCLPFVTVGGKFIAMKGTEVKGEIAEADYALHVLGKAAIQTHSLQLPENRGKRHIVVLQKRDHSPNRFPRKAGLPTKQPLLAKK